MTTRISAAFVALWIAAVATGAVRQAPQPPPRFRTGVEVVELDVSAIDKDGRPVRGLTAADFTVLEDGKPQLIVQFTAVDIPDPPPTPTKWVRDVAPDVKDNVVADRRLFIILLDDARVPVSPAIVKATKETARSLVNRLGPSDLAAGVFTANNAHAQDFTSDRARLLAAIDTFTFTATRDVLRQPMVIGAGGGGLRSPGPLPDVGPDILSFQSTISALRQIADLMADVPHQRKILMYISVGVPVSGLKGQLLFLLDDLFRFARLSNVNVYSFDPAGFGANNAATDYLRLVANNTGGRAFVQTNDLERGVAEMVRENSSYYLVAYQSSNPKNDGRFRKIDVRVDRPGVTVRTRNGYNASREAKAGVTKPPPPPVTTAVAGLLPRSDLQMRATIAPFAIPGRSEVALAITVAVREPTAEEVGVDGMEFLTSAFGPSGEPRGSQKQTATIVLRGTALDPQAQFELLSRFDLKPGSYNFRFGAQSALSHKTGSVYSAVDVPDFAKDVVSLSGVVLSAPGIDAGPKEALTSLIPVMPTTQRAFVKSDDVVAFLRIYQQAKGALEPVQLDVRIVDDHDAVKFHAAETLTADRFDASRAVDHRFNLPLADLPPGPYLLTIEATTGKASARRDVRFVVR